MPCLYDAGPPLALRLGASGHTDVIQILLGILTTHLTLMTANGAFDNNFGSGRWRSIHVGRGHTFQATRFEGLRQGESTSAEGLYVFFEGARASGQHDASRPYNFLGFAAARWYTKTSR
jgi:hypothetical protein